MQNKLNNKEEFLLVSEDFTFDYGHYLPHYVGNCRNQHGHTAILKVTVMGPVMSSDGMVIDFRYLKSIVWKILDKLDHKNLNDILDNPTTENLIIFIRDELQKELEMDDKVNNKIKLYSLILSEGMGKYASWILEKETCSAIKTWEMQVKRQEEIGKKDLLLKEIAGEILVEAGELYDACREKWWNKHKNKGKGREARIHESIDILRFLITYWTMEGLGMEEVYSKLKSRIEEGTGGEISE